MAEPTRPVWPAMKIRESRSICFMLLSIVTRHRILDRNEGFCESRMSSCDG